MDSTMSDPQDAGLLEAGRRLGHDLCRMTRWTRDETWPASVLEGFDEALHRRPGRGGADRFERKWLQLRLGALARGRLVADDVTPDLLRELDLDLCPVTRRRLTHGAQGPDDWSVDRLNNDGAYAAGNLALMSAMANRAKGTRGFDEVLELSRAPRATHGLRPEAWLRLAALMLGPSFVERPRAAPLLPLCAPLPCRSVRLGIQQIQRLFTVHAKQQSGKNQLIRHFRASCPSQAALWRLEALAEELHQAFKTLDAEEESWDVWLRPSTMEALARWHESLGERGQRLAARIAGEWSCATRESLTTLQPWSLRTRGYATPPAFGAERSTRVTAGGL